MTRSDAVFYRLAMPCPFAGKSNAVITPIENTDAGNVNFETGFPSAYSAPASNNGKYVSRGEMNAIGNLASQNQFFFLAGGVNTFDAEFAAAIGGYPEGAVLKYLNNGYLYDVISLVDNNTYNFTANGVDGVNWKYLSVTEKLVFDDVFFEGGSGLSVGTTFLGSVVAKKSGTFALVNSISPVLSGELVQWSYSGVSNLAIPSGCGLMIREVGDGESASSIDIPKPVEGSTTYAAMDWNGWKSLSGDFSLVTTDNSTSTSSLFFGGELSQTSTGFLTNLTQGKTYLLALMCGIGSFSNDITNLRAVFNTYASLQGSVKIMYT